MSISEAQEELQRRAFKAGASWRAHVDRWDLEDRAPYDEVAASIVDAGLVGLTMPRQYGGQDLTVLDYVLTIEALIRSSQSWIVAEPTFGSTGPGPSIVLRAEHEETRSAFLPDIVAGRKACAIALTEPEYGSDLTNLETSAVDDGDAWVLNGSKRFITGAPVNDLYATFVRFGDIPGYRGIGAIVVEKGTPGLRLERGAQFVGTRGLPHGELHFTDCRVPKRNLIRGPGHFGDLMMAFNMERMHNATLHLGLAEAAYEEAKTYVENRQAFGKRIIQFQSAYHSLVEMRLAIEAHRMLVYRAAATAQDGKFPLADHSGLAKLSGNLLLPDLTFKAMVLCGGEGTTIGHAAQRLHRDSMAALVAGGSPAVLKNMLASQFFPEQRLTQ
jgi:butyryl-CoA dehydrogenase